MHLLIFFYEGICHQLSKYKEKERVLVETHISGWFDAMSSSTSRAYSAVLRTEFEHLLMSFPSFDGVVSQCNINQTV